MTMMKAVRMHGYGSPEVLRYEDAPRPTIGDDEVLIRVHAVAVNPLDWKIRSGLAIEWFQPTLPLILGIDVAGVIAAVGAAVKDLAIGDEVYTAPTIGGYADYVAVPANRVAHKPRSVDYVQAAAMSIGGLVARQALFDAAHLAPGQTVLIHGAAGGVGVLAVQLAKWRGARVIGTASAHNLAFLRELGADEVINYTTTRFETVVRDVDVVLDTVGGETLERSWAVLKQGGMLVSIVDLPSPTVAAAHGVQQCTVDLQADAKQLADLAGMVDTGQIKPIVSTVLPLQEASQAHVLSESRHTRGKIVLQVVT